MIGMLLSPDKNDDDDYLSDERIKEFEEYIAVTNVMGPMLDPTMYAHKGGFTALDLAKDRLRIVKILKEHLKKYANSIGEVKV